MSIINLTLASKSGVAVPDMAAKIFAFAESNDLTVATMGFSGDDMVAGEAAAAPAEKPASSAKKTAAKKSSAKKAAAKPKSETKEDPAPEPAADELPEQSTDVGEAAPDPARRVVTIEELQTTIKTALKDAEETGADKKLVTEAIKKSLAFFDLKKVSDLDKSKGDEVHFDLLIKLQKAIAEVEAA